MNRFLAPIASFLAVKGRRRTVLTLALTCSVLTTWLAGTFAYASDWPTYLHDPSRTAANTGESTLSPANAAKITRQWSFKTGDKIAASATVVGGVVYVGSWDGFEYALNASDGTMRWQTKLGTTSTNQAGCFPNRAGVSSAATVVGNVVYVGGGDSNWYALNAATGAPLWHVFTGDNSQAGGHYNWSSPLIYNGSAYIGVSSLGDCPLVPGQLLKVDLTSHVVNTFNVVKPGEVGGGIWTSPSVDPATNTIFVTTGTEANFNQQYVLSMVALDATTLGVKWSWHLPKNQAAADSDWGTTPTLFDDASGRHLVAAINKNGIAYAFTRDSTSTINPPVWTQSIAVGGVCPVCGQGSVSSGAFGAGRLYLAGGQPPTSSTMLGNVRALDPATGKVLWEHDTLKAVVPALAYANGLVIDGAGPTLEVLNASNGTPLFSFQTGDTIYGAPSIANGQIFAGSTDHNLYAFGLPSTQPNCPAGWSCSDVGSPTTKGTQSLTGGTWSVSGGGNDIWGTSDQFHYASQQLAANGSVQAKVVSQQNTNPWAKAGVMLRQSSDPGSPYYAMFTTPGNGIVVQYRTAQGAVAARAATVAGVPPAYLRVVASGTSFTAYTSTNATTWTPVPGSTRTIQMSGPRLAGLAVTSHRGSMLGQVSFDTVTVG